MPNIDPVRNTYICEPLVPESGTLPIPEGPGLGVALSEMITGQPRVLVVE